MQNINKEYFSDRQFCIIWRKKNNTSNKKWPGKKKYIQFSLYGERNKSIYGRKKAFLRTVKKKLTPSLTSEHRGWNTGKGDCGHYHSHLDFSVHIETMRGFMDERIKNLTPPLPFNILLMDNNTYKYKKKGF